MTSFLLRPPTCDSSALQASVRAGSCCPVPRKVSVCKSDRSGKHSPQAAAQHMEARHECSKATNITWHKGAVSREQKEQLLCQHSCVIWFTGLSGAGKSTVACCLEHALHKRGVLTALLDGDNIRHGLNNNLGFSAEDRAENIRRVGEVTKLFVDAGVIAIASFISPYAADRDAVRQRLGHKDFVEVYMQIPLCVCEERDTKGLYKLARQGKIKGFTGIDDPYEEPAEPEIVLEHTDAHGNVSSPEAMACTIIQYLQDNGHLQSPCH